jgi:hypothetical protein
MDVKYFRHLDQIASVDNIFATASWGEARDLLRNVGVLGAD